MCYGEQFVEALSGRSKVSTEKCLFGSTEPHNPTNTERQCMRLHAVGQPPLTWVGNARWIAKATSTLAKIMSSAMVWCTSRSDQTEGEECTAECKHNDENKRTSTHAKKDLQAYMHSPHGRGGEEREWASNGTWASPTNRQTS
jgi:hypothetical protein